ncbi:MAG: quinone-dependent dihydroorotate dehydrogenase [Salibacteraceae bacterium]
MYKAVLRPLLYSLSPERAHYFAADSLSLLESIGLTKKITETWFRLDHPSLEREVFGLKFPNPVGLAAGFDKDAKWIAALEMLGFGFIEIGTLTPLSQPGNEKPRLFRLLQDEALINRMGFNNDGVDAAVKRIATTQSKTPIGGNIGKNKVTPNENAVQDYLYSFKALYDQVDYFAVNVSSPNTPGLRELQGKDELRKIFDALFEERAKRKISRPVLLKIAPDLNPDQLIEIIQLVKEITIDGLIVSNTTLARENLCSDKHTIEQLGGLSGKPVAQKSTDVIRFISKESNNTIPMIGVGGIHSAEDALEKLNAGASLIQLYTGFIYEGPQLIKDIKKALINAN